MALVCATVVTSLLPSSASEAVGDLADELLATLEAAASEYGLVVETKLSITTSPTEIEEPPTVTAVSTEADLLTQALEM